MDAKNAAELPSIPLTATGITRPSAITRLARIINRSNTAALMGQV